MSGERSQDMPFSSLVPASPVIPSARVTTIDMLPDEVVLEIFDSYKRTTYHWIAKPLWNWQTLAHVCRRWRNIIFASPQRLDLRIPCTHRTPRRKYMDSWPRLPISITFFGGDTLDAEGEDNIIAALEQRDRVCQISLFNLKSSVLRRFATFMEEPFPALRDLTLSSLPPSLDATAPALPRLFGGSAPYLRSLVLHGIPLSALPNVVLSTNLNFLRLFRIPYISPPAMVTVLLALTNLNTLSIQFCPSQSRPLEMSPLPRTRAVLPALIHFKFYGSSEYLEDFIARIDTPLLARLRISLVDHVFNILRLKEFIDRTERFKPLEHVLLSPWSIKASLRSTTGLPTGLILEITSRMTDRQVSSMGQVCNQLSHLLSQVERLDISDRYGNKLGWQDDNDADSTQWLHLLISFVSVESLYVSKLLGPGLACSLQELNGERVTEIWPALQNLFLEGLQPSGTELEGMKAFVAARQFSGHPVVLQRWEKTPEYRALENDYRVRSIVHAPH
jgi:hypothetical protein